jgi:sec-independent protein translocase protein TatA
MFGLGAQELLIILAIGLLLFGKKLPDLARSLGRAVTEFRREATALTEEPAGPCGRPG